MFHNKEAIEVEPESGSDAFPLLALLVSTERFRLRTFRKEMTFVVGVSQSMAAVVSSVSNSISNACSRPRDSITCDFLG